MKNGLIHIYEGDGKGKTTACVGLSVRCAGSEQKVVFAQFLKTNTSSELKVLAKIENIKLVLCDKTFGFAFKMTDEEKKEARSCYTDYLKKVIKEAVDSNADMLILDEMIATYNYDLVEKDVLLDFLNNKPEGLEVVMSGRDPAPELVELAGYVSCVTKVKHPYEDGVASRKGVEF